MNDILFVFRPIFHALVSLFYRLNTILGFSLYFMLSEILIISDLYMIDSRRT